MSERIVLHSDLNNCYASIECMLHPELKGKYIAVCGNTAERHGIVLAKNQLAKKCGVKTGDVIWEAKQKCPQLTIVPPHMDEYASLLVYSGEQMQVISENLGHASCDITSRVYAHVYPEAKQRTAKTISNILNNKQAAG